MIKIYKMLYDKRTGSGKIIVFIHGNSQSLEIWDGLITEPLLANYKLIRIDLPGHGHSFRSTDPAKDYTLKGIATHIKDFLMSLDEEYLIVANSLGCNQIAEITLQLPFCRGLFFTGASVIGQKITISDVVKPNPFFGVTFTAQPGSEELRGLVGTWSNRMDKKLEEQNVGMFLNTDPALRTQLGLAIAQGDWSDEIFNLEQLDYPVAVVYGADEKVIFPDYLSKTAIPFWQNRIIQITDAGHCCQLDQPGLLSALINQYAADIFKSAGS